MVLASHTVHVTSEANTSPSSTAFTSTSALTNIPHGLRSRGSSARAGGIGTAGASGTCAIAEEAPKIKTDVSDNGPTLIQICTHAPPQFDAVFLELSPLE